MARVEMRIAVAKVPRYGQDESGDSLEIIERPGGGYSCVLVSGHGSGRAAKTLSNLLAARAIALLKDGARDGAVARAVHDYLYTYRMGQALAALNILSIDRAVGKILITRQNPAPIYILTRDGLRGDHSPSMPIGGEPLLRPQISELPIDAPTYVILFSAGLLRAGERRGDDLSLANRLALWPVLDGADPQVLAESILQHALQLDDQQPVDDMSVVVLGIRSDGDSVGMRRMTMSASFDVDHTLRTAAMVSEAEEGADRP